MHERARVAGHPGQPAGQDARLGALAPEDEGAPVHGVEVELGPRCGESYPVVRGLEPGQKVAAAGR